MCVPICSRLLQAPTLKTFSFRERRPSYSQNREEGRKEEGCSLRRGGRGDPALMSPFAGGIRVLWNVPWVEISRWDTPVFFWRCVSNVRACVLSAQWVDFSCCMFSYMFGFFRRGIGGYLQSSSVIDFCFPSFRQFKYFRTSNVDNNCGEKQNRTSIQSFRSMRFVWISAHGVSYVIS